MLRAQSRAPKNSSWKYWNKLLFPLKSRFARYVYKLHYIPRDSFVDWRGSLEPHQYDTPAPPKKINPEH